MIRLSVVACHVLIRCNHCNLSDVDLLTRQNGPGLAISHDIMRLGSAMRSRPHNIGVSNEEQTMEDINPDLLRRHSDAQRGLTVSGVPVLRNLEGHRCPSCGSRRYVLVFRLNGNTRSGLLAARCSNCREPKELTPSEIERECRPDETIGKNQHNRRILL